MDTKNSPRLAARKKSHPHRQGHEPADKDPAYRSNRGHRKNHRHHDKGITNLDLGNLSRASGQRTGNDMVQNWLAQSTIANQNYPTVSEDHVGPINTHQTHGLHEQRQFRSLPRDTRSSARPRPRGSPLEAGTRLRSPPQGFVCSPNSHKRALSDSSILSVRKNRIVSSKDRYNASHHASAFHGPAPAELSRRSEVAVDGSSSDEPASPIQAYRSKKPRNKTRDDKYEHKKDKHRSKKSVEDRPLPKSSKRKKEDKKRALTSSKNVMSNWASKAVLNDRITVQQPIKPGIFQNGREANKKPVQDLVFSDMNFLQGRKELENQQREMKEVSSFFLPAEAPGEIGHQGGLDQETSRRLQERSASSTRRYNASKSSQSEPSVSREHILGEQVLQRYRDSEASVHDIEGDRRSQDDHHRAISSRDSRPTTNISWSTSPPRSPLRTNGSISQASSGTHDRRTTTPETVRRALVDSGIFRGTGIATYDKDYVSPNSKPITDGDQNGTESCGNEDIASEYDLGRHEIQHRLEILYPPAWRVDHSQAGQDPPSKPRLSGVDSGSTCDPERKRQHLRSTTAGDVRKDTAESAKIKLRDERATQEKPDERRGSQCYSRLDEAVNHHAACVAGLDNDDRLSITSRDLMPPPPLPHNVLRPRLSGAEQKPFPTGPDTRYYPTDEELSAAARVMAQHDTIHGIIGPKAPSETGHDMLTEGSSQYGIAPLQSASWVTPSPKPPTPSLTADTTISRLSPMPSYDVDRLVGKRSFPTRSQARSDQSQESMAEFIARIEREADVIPPTPMTEHLKAREVVSSIPDTRCVDGGYVEIETADFGNVFDDGMGSSSSVLHENQSLHLPLHRASYWMDRRQLTTGDLDEPVHLANYGCPSQ
ncbi:hypothetical protein PG994_010711 [Apiospora phragmitis]|uniref:Uncharacterized protein n=1 Tax=Apiospora phragmitis TaxID=2905665 RepID=A0ABR1TSX3_9PEZI